MRIFSELGRIANEWSAAANAVSQDKDAVENAHEQAKLALKNGGRKIAAPVIKVDGEKHAVFTDGSTTKTVKL